MIREATPLSRARSNDFPSPRIGGSGKNYEVLPHFQEDSQGRALESKEYMMAHFKGLEKAKKNRRKSLPGVGGHVPKGPLKVISFYQILLVGTILLLRLTYASSF
jgi:hypothetical protein